MNEIEIEDNCVKDTKKIYTWRDWLMAIYFAFQIVFGIINMPYGVVSYDIATIIVGTIGLASVLLKYKRVESVAIVVVGLLLLARAILLIPGGVAQDNVTLIDWVGDVVTNRALADGMIAFLPLTVLSLYRRRRGRLTR